jgi:exopolyphosphatase/guanosine-5'-triphosphate,3'-diphosphate pyrophosphatase
MADRIGIIDLGSNTFHLLIVETGSNQSFTTVYKERSFVGLAENGIEVLSQKAIDKGLETLSKFKSILNEFGVNNFKVTGTAALRSAKNKDVFINTAKEQLGIEIEVIKGEREADLIFKGVSLLHKMGDNYIIMDIGGGSVEFIVVKNSLSIWSKSYNIGVGVLHNNYHETDPISKVEISQLIAFLYTTLEELRSMVKDLKIHAIIGASGSFEVVESMNGKTISNSKISEISLDDYWNVSSRIIEASISERNQMEGLPSSRVKLIVVSMILIDLVIEMANPTKIMISPYALKEGLLSELIT